MSKRTKATPVNMTEDTRQAIKKHPYYVPPQAGRYQPAGSGVSGFVRHCIAFCLEAYPEQFKEYVDRIWRENEKTQ